MIAAVTRLVLLAHIAIALPAIAAVVVPGTDIHPNRAVLAGVLFLASLGMGAVELRRVERPSRPEVPSAAVAIAHLVLLSAAVAVIRTDSGWSGAADRYQRYGTARVSEKHANFVENMGDATTADVIALMGEGRRRVRERFGVELEPEVQLLGEVDTGPLWGER